MMMTAFEEEHTAGMAIIVGAQDFIKKPFSLNEFSVRLHKMINDSEAQRGMKREKDVDKDIQKSTNELEPPKQTKKGEDVDKFIQEFINELEPPKRMKREKDEDDGMRKFLDELETSLKKI
jgi:DNA-binding response OmpR family regulator